MKIIYIIILIMLVSTVCDAKIIGKNIINNFPKKSLMNEKKLFNAYYELKHFKDCFEDCIHDEYCEIKPFNKEAFRICIYNFRQKVR